MKNSIQNIIKKVFIFSLFFIVFSAQAQAPQKFSYQAVIRNASNTLVANANVGIKVSILQGSPIGNATYVETHTSITNANGLVNLQIGGGTVASGSFTGINWSSGTYYIKIETDITGGTNFNIEGTSQLLSVPYALSSADNRWAANPNGINNVDGNVGVGTNLPNYKLHVGTSLNAMRIEGPGSNGGTALSMGGFGKIEIDAPGIIGGRFNIRDNGNIAIGSSVPATSKLEVNGFTKLGLDAPAIKIKKLTGTTSSFPDGVVQIFHGLNSAKILAVNVLIENQPGQFVPPNYTIYGGYEIFFTVSAVSINIQNSNVYSNPIFVSSKPVRILITYEE